MAHCSSSSCEITFAKVDVRDGPQLADSARSQLNQLMSVPTRITDIVADDIRLRITRI
jgi:hypothetical protein